MKTYLTLSLSLIVTTVACCQGPFVLWDESVNGPFPDGATPLASLQVGTNAVIGATELVPTGPNWIGHPDFFIIQIPDDLVVNAIHLQVDRPSLWAWIGDPTFSTELAFTQNPSSGELLLQWGLPSMRAGRYGMYVSNTDTQPFTTIANYRLEFVAVPEPGVLALLLIGGSALLVLRHQIR
jgi:hypothetical protein